MNRIDEQQARHAASMAFFQSAADAWEEIKALLKADDEEQQRLEREWQERRCKPEVNGE